MHVAGGGDQAPLSSQKGITLHSYWPDVPQEVPLTVRVDVFSVSTQERQKSAQPVASLNLQSPVGKLKGETDEPFPFNQKTTLPLPSGEYLITAQMGGSSEDNDHAEIQINIPEEGQAEVLHVVVDSLPVEAVDISNGDATTLSLITQTQDGLLQSTLPGREKLGDESDSTGQIYVFGIGNDGSPNLLTKGRLGTPGQATSATRDNTTQLLFVAQRNSNEMTVYSRKMDGSRGSLIPLPPTSTPSTVVVDTASGLLFSLDLSANLLIFEKSSDGEYQQRNIVSFNAIPTSLALAPNHRLLFVGDQQGLVRIFRIGEDKQLTELNPVMIGSGVGNILIHPSELWMYVGSASDKLIYQLSLSSDGEAIKTKEIATPIIPKALFFDAEGETLSIINSDNEVKEKSGVKNSTSFQDVDRTLIRWDHRLKNPRTREKNQDDTEPFSPPDESVEKAKTNNKHNGCNTHWWLHGRDSYKWKHYILWLYARFNSETWTTWGTSAGSCGEPLYVDSISLRAVPYPLNSGFTKFSKIDSKTNSISMEYKQSIFLGAPPCGITGYHEATHRGVKWSTRPNIVGCQKLGLQ